MPFVDLHCDTIARLLAARRSGLPGNLRQGTGGHVDLETLQKSGYLLQNFALFVNLQGIPLSEDLAARQADLYHRAMDCRGKDPLEEVLTLADLYWQELAQNTDIAQPVLSFQEMEQARQAGKVACLLTVEEGGVCRGQLSLLRTLYRLGVRMLTLTWNYPNELGFPNGQPGGLTETGAAFLAEMETLGMIPDVSHLGDEGFWEVCRRAKKPFAASHSCCRALWDHRRNLTDAMLRALGDRGCLVGVNFYAGFLGPSPVSRFEDLTRHIRHMIDMAGLETVALGSDFDGIDCPLAWEDAGHMDRLIPAMERAGFSPREIEAVCWKNAWEFYRRTL